LSSFFCKRRFENEERLEEKIEIEKLIIPPLKISTKTKLQDEH
jgi:hypothetical protein